MSTTAPTISSTSTTCPGTRRRRHSRVGTATAGGGSLVGAEGRFLLVVAVLAATPLWARFRDDSLARAPRDLWHRRDEE